MKRFLFCASIAITMLFVGCSKESDLAMPNNIKKGRKFVATIEDNQTRLHAEKPNIVWDVNDLISIIDGDNNLSYIYDDEDKSFSPSENNINNIEVPEGEVYAVYPYDENNSVTDGKFSLTLPANQSYAENSFGDGANTMVAVSNGNDLYFKNVGGYIELKLYGNDVTVKSIKFEGNSGEQLSGNVIVSFDGDGNPTYEWNPASSNAETKVLTLTCPNEGITLGNTDAEATSFWFVVPPQTFNNGFTITITDTNGINYIKRTTKSIELQRNHLKPMAAFNIFENVLWCYVGDERYPVPVAPSSEGGIDMSNIFPIEINPETFEASSSENLEIRKMVTRIVVPEGITSVGTATFAYCTNLESIVLPSTLTSIGMGAFGFCQNLRSITIPNGVESIGDLAFMLSGLEGELVIPDSVESIGMGAFAQTNIEKVVIPDSVTGSIHSTFMGCTKLTDVTIGSGITELNHTVFSGCKSLEKIVIPNTIKEIEECVFENCTSLKEVIFEENSQLRFMWMNTFYNCTSLKSIVLPASIGVPQSGFASGLGASLFKGCTNLTSVYLLSDTPPVINDFTCTDISKEDYNYPFPHTNDGFKIYVPSEAAKTAYLGNELWEIMENCIEVGSPE